MFTQMHDNPIKFIKLKNKNDKTLGYYEGQVDKDGNREGTGRTVKFDIEKDSFKIIEGQI